MNDIKDDAHFMRIALECARQSKPSPNPQVGAVIVKNNTIVSKGHHKKPGMPHAEIEAINNAKESLKGATIYVTLEPCCHTGRTGPCTIALIQKQFARVVIGIEDPDENVAGKGIKQLRDHGIEVDVNVLKEECKMLLEAYIHHRQTGRPQVHLKAAITLDGHIATEHGNSKWITGPKAREYGHHLRAQNDAILVGINTVLSDDPLLTVRNIEGNNPVRVVLDSSLKIPLSCKLLNSSEQGLIIIFHSPMVDAVKKERFAQIKNVRLIECAKTPEGALDLDNVINELNQLGILSVLIEGGAQIHGSFLERKLADKFSVFIAPKLIGRGINWANIQAKEKISDSILGNFKTTTLLDQDVLIEGTFSK